jgi:hypothetical protein
LKSQLADLDSRIEGLESEKATLEKDFEQLRGNFDQLRAAVAGLDESVPHEEIGKKLGQELYDFLLKDSKVPHMVIDGVGKFIDFRKYLGLAAARGAEESTRQSEQTLRNVLSE